LNGAQAIPPEGLDDQGQPGGSPDPRRDELRKASAALASARQAELDAEAALNRLVAIAQDAEVAEAAVKKAIAADGGAALKAYSQGQQMESEIGRLVTRQEQTARAAAAAKLAIQGAQDAHAAATTERRRLEAALDDAAILYLKRRAQDEHARYMQLFKALGATYDRLCGIAVALSHSNHAEMMTTAVPVPFSVPGFNTSLGGWHGASEQVVHKRAVDEHAVRKVQAGWAAARERLREDPDADVADLLGLQQE
jgi:hypothetical protein